MQKQSRRIPVLSFAVSMALAGLAPQGTFIPISHAAQLEEIVVTARKREETSLEVPVAITALNARMLESNGLNSIDNIAQRVPGLLIGEESGSVQGGGITLRGIGSAGSQPLGDAAVSYNIDGVQVSKNSVRRMGQFDLQQIEVLRGPQALFFGKNSPGGVISMRTANPTDEFTAKIQAGYEFNAKEVRTEGFISGPLTDTIGYRLAGYTSDMDGWLEDGTPSNSPYGFSVPDAPNQDEFGVRGTLHFEPNDSFDATLKLSYGELNAPGVNQAVQVVDCPLGASQFELAVGLTPATRGDDCKPGKKTVTADWGPFLDAQTIGSKLAAAGKARNDQDQKLFGLEMNYHPSDSLTLTSVTGYYNMSLDNIANFTNTWTTSLLPSNNWLDNEDFTQELRISSDFDGRFNFQAGAFFQDGNSVTGSHTFVILAPNTGTEANEYEVDVDTNSWSAFAQLRYEITNTVELALGGRYTEETKELNHVVVDLVDAANGNTFLYELFNALPITTLPTFGTPAIPVTPSVDKVTFYNWSPEVTLSWKPTDNLNIYGNYKKGFLSGGFNGSSGISNPANNPMYQPQETEGYEVGIKGEFLDGTLRTGLAAYDYDVTGLQVVVVINDIEQILQNVGETNTKGIEADFEWLTPIDGLSIYGALTWNDAKYDDYQANCYRGQTASSPVPCLMQTNRFTGVTGLFQDLSGTDLVRAPEYTGNLGINYGFTFSNGMNLGLGVNATFSDSFIAAVSSKPRANSPSYTIVNANISLSPADGSWEIALIGSNLTEDYFWTQHTDVPFTGSPPTGVATTGTEFLADTAAGVNRDRQIMLRFTYNFGAY